MLFRIPLEVSFDYEVSLESLLKYYLKIFSTLTSSFHFLFDVTIFCDKIFNKIFLAKLYDDKI